MSLLRVSTFALASLMLLSAAAPLAAAHKTDYSADGSIRVVWGFLNEPAVTMTKTGLDLSVRDNATNWPIPGLENELNVTLSWGDQTFAFEDLAGQFGRPGFYTEVITLTQPGRYTLRVTGVVNGTAIDVVSPGAHDIEGIESTYFPATDGDASLAARVATLETQVQQLRQQQQTQATTPVDTTPQGGSGIPGPSAGLLIGALAAVAVAIALRRRS